MQQTVGGEAAELKALYLAVSQFAQGFDPNVVSGADATLMHGYASRLESVAATIKALALVRVDETDAYTSSGHRSAADWGAAKTGTSPSDALRGIKRARNARRLPRTEEAMRNGELSPAQADAITDAGRLNPEAEADLLRAAKTDDLATLKKKARRAKSSADPNVEARNRRIHARRSLRHWTNDEGEFHAHLCTTPDAGARLLAGLEPHRKAAFHAARKAGRREAPEAYAADALDALARGATPEPAQPSTPPAGSSSPTATGRSRPGSPDRPKRDTSPRDPSEARTTRPEPSDTDADTPGDRGDELIDLTDNAASTDAPSTSGSPPGAPPPTRSQPRATVHLNIDFAPLARGHLEPGDVCEIPGVGPISLSAAKALLGDATVDLIIKKGDDIRSVVHLGRTVTIAQRRALEARDPCCIRPGCGRTHNLEIDHRDGWAITHETSLDELGRLCPYEHDLKTHHGHTYSGSPGHWKWHLPGEHPDTGTADADADPDVGNTRPAPTDEITDQTDLFSSP